MNRTSLTSLLVVAALSSHRPTSSFAETVAPEPAPPAPAQPAPLPVARPAQPAPVMEPAPAERGESPSIWPAVGTSVATVGLIVVAVWSRSAAQDRAELAKFALTTEAYEDDESSIGTYNLVMVTSASLAVVGAAVSGYLWYRALGSSSKTQLEVNARTDGASLGLRGSF